MNSLEDRLKELEMITPTKDMIQVTSKGKFTEAYQKRLTIIKEIEENKGAHRKIIFADSPDITMNPQLDKIGEMA